MNNKIKIIFLDIDGVLNVYCESRDKYGCTFHANFVDNLKHIIEETGAKIVITSNWKADGIKSMQNMWRDRNLPGEVIDITRGRHDRKRGKEIQDYLNEHKDEIIDYVIIDDDDIKIKNKQFHLVKTSGNTDHEDCVDIGYGLTKECSEQAIILLNKTDVTFEIEDRLFKGKFTKLNNRDYESNIEFEIDLNKKEDIEFFKGWYYSKLSSNCKYNNNKDVNYFTFQHYGKLISSFPIYMESDDVVKLSCLDYKITFNMDCIFD